MPAPVVALAGATIGSAAIGASSAKKAASAQASAAEKAADAQLEATRLTVDEERRQYDQSREDLAPYRETGYGALDAQNYLVGLGEKPEGYAGFEASPGYQFRLDQGQEALERNAAARGLRLSSGTMKDMMRFGQGEASQDYWNQYNALAGLSGTGQSATNTTAQLGANAAGNIGNALMAGGQAKANAYTQSGQATASGIMGANSAIQGGIGNMSSLLMMNQLGAFGAPATTGSLFGGNSWG